MVTFEYTPQDSALRHAYDANRRKQAEFWYFAIRYFIRETKDIEASRKWLNAYVSEYGNSDYSRLLEETLAQIKPVSRLGHILTTRFMEQDTPRYVIGQYRNWKKITVYVLSEWNGVSQRFLEIAEGDFLFERSTMSKAPYTMPETIKAMSRAYRLIEILRLLKKRLHRVESGVVDCQKIVAQTSYRGRFDMLDKTGYVDLNDEPDFLFGNAQIKAETIALQKKLADRWYEEMTIAGIFNEAISE